jgi:hypothetical protein
VSNVLSRGKGILLEENSNRCLFHPIFGVGEKEKKMPCLHGRKQGTRK